MDFVPCHLYLESRSITPNNGRYRWDFNDPYLSAYKDYNITFVRATIPNLVYGFTAYNNKLYIKENGGGTITITIPTNDYSGSQMATRLQALFNAATLAPLVYTVTYDSQAQKMTVSVAGVNTIQFVSGTASAYRELGWYTLPTAAAASLTSEYPVQLGGTNYLVVVASFASEASIGSTLSNGIGCIIPVDVPFGGVIYFSPESPNMYLTQEGYLTEIEISFRDERGNDWIPPPTIYFEFCVRVTPRD